MATISDKQRPFLTPKELAHELGVTPAVVYRSVERGELPHIRLLPRGAIRIPRSVLDPEPRP
jgi:excisionase family DNA binding protein